MKKASCKCLTLGLSIFDKREQGSFLLSPALPRGGPGGSASLATVSSVCGRRSVSPVGPPWFRLCRSVAARAWQLRWLCSVGPHWSIYVLLVSPPLLRGSPGGSSWLRGVMLCMLRMRELLFWSHNVKKRRSRFSTPNFTSSILQVPGVMLNLLGLQELPSLCSKHCSYLKLKPPTWASNFKPGPPALSPAPSSILV